MQRQYLSDTHELVACNGVTNPILLQPLVDHLRDPDVCAQEVEAITATIAGQLTNTAEALAKDQWRDNAESGLNRLQTETSVLQAIATDPAICRKMKEDFPPTVAILIANTRQITGAADDHGIALQASETILRSCNGGTDRAKSQIDAAKICILGFAGAGDMPFFAAAKGLHIRKHG